MIPFMSGLDESTSLSSFRIMLCNVEDDTESDVLLAMAESSERKDHN